MKIALYIEDGLEQIVLTPESETEKGILGKLHDDSREFELKRGSFYKCQGGWVRYSQPWRGKYDSRDKDDESTMIVLAPRPNPPMPGAAEENCMVCGAGPHLGCHRYACPQKDGQGA